MKKTASASQKNSRHSAIKRNARSTIDSAEVQQFNEIADQWWDENGALKPLHRLNPVRMGYLKKQICDHYRLENEGFSPLKGLKVLDIGCGGGLVTEPFCRLGAAVTGIDAGKDNIKAASAHARQQGLDIVYKTTTAEDMTGSFDVVTALEIIEHVADPALFISACCKLVKKNGLIILSTLNRTPRSYLLGIIAAERILGWVPPGTHDWKKFLRPAELARPLAEAGFEVTDVRGLVYNPLARQFSLSETDMAVNYFLTARK